MAKRISKTAVMVDGVNSGFGDQVRMVERRPTVQVVCPSEDAVIAQPCFTFQMAATPGVDGVQVSIDRSEWVACRESLGLWWYDWSGFEKGEHQLLARTHMGNGIAVDSAARRFSVD
ncbi:MAG: hypothetical protein A2506_07685 [Elusimicrobia bacterium RIFOXYD12_FULL_66_9]|nr:MAG: hypothetical protein A2506_07685 [Elusimicrobia bacterium RIFOXYD12_FULL_66_9]